jgi:hypothetical protein
MGREVHVNAGHVYWQRFQRRGWFQNYWLVKNFVDQFGFDAAADRILPSPRGVVWNAYERFMAEPWEGLAVNPRNADMTAVRLATYNIFVSLLLLRVSNRRPVILSVCLPT